MDEEEVVTIATLLSAWLGSEIFFTALTALGVAPKVAGGAVIAAKVFPHIKTVLDMAASKPMTEQEKLILEESRRQVYENLGINSQT